MTATLVAAGLLSGCGKARQDVSEKAATYDLRVLSASFPARQTLSRPTRMLIRVRNDGSTKVPDVAVTVNSFNMISNHAGLADPSRPVWIIDQEPVGGASAYVNTWTGGSMAPGQVHTFLWRVTPVVSGTHRLRYRIAAGLNGKAKAQLPGGGIPEGNFSVKVTSTPSQARVDPSTGRVVGSAPSGGAG